MTGREVITWVGTVLEMIVSGVWTTGEISLSEGILSIRIGRGIGSMKIRGRRGRKDTMARRMSEGLGTMKEEVPAIIKVDHMKEESYD